MSCPWLFGSKCHHSRGFQNPALGPISAAGSDSTQRPKLAPMGPNGSVNITSVTPFPEAVYRGMLRLVEVSARTVSMEGFDGPPQEPLEAADHLSLKAYLGGKDNRTPKGRNVREREDMAGQGVAGS